MLNLEIVKGLPLVLRDYVSRLPALLLRDILFIPSQPQEDTSRYNTLTD